MLRAIHISGFKRMFRRTRFRFKAWDLGNLRRFSFAQLCNNLISSSPLTQRVLAREIILRFKEELRKPAGRAGIIRIGKMEKLVRRALECKGVCEEARVILTLGIA